MSFICHIHNYTEYNEEWNVFSAFNPSKCTHLEQWAADCAVPGEQSWTSCRSRDSNPQPWVTSGFKSNALSIRPTTAHQRSIKAAKWQYKNKVEEQFNTNNGRNMWQGISNITGFKGNKPATMNIAASLLDELHTFYARFEAHNTAHTESAPAAPAEEVSPLSLSVTAVTRSFKRVNIRKAVGPDGIPDRVVKAFAFQLARGFYRHFQPFTDTTVIGLITDNDETAYREEVCTLTK